MMGHESQFSTDLFEAGEHEGVAGLHGHLHILHQGGAVLNRVPHRQRLTHAAEGREVCRHSHGKQRGINKTGLRHGDLY